MKRIFLFLSVILIFITTTLANPPPISDLGGDQTEFILSIDQSIDIPVDIIAEIYHPTTFTVTSIPAIPEVNT